MGQQLEAFYLQASNYGLQARVRLAMMTLIPSNKAAQVPDTPEIISKFTEAMRLIEQNYKKLR